MLHSQDNQHLPTEDHLGSTDMASRRGDTGKLFVGGLNWTTTDASLRAYFEQFGAVETACIMKDPATGRSRGFGFVVFQDSSLVGDILNQQHQLDGKMIDPKRAVPKAEQERTEKLFVAGIPVNTQERDLVRLFSEYGHVLDATIMADRNTGKPRGFGFVTFQDSTGIERALDAAHNVKLNGKLLEVKRAMPKGGRVRPPNHAALTSAMANTGAGSMATHSGGPCLPGISMSSRASTGSSASSTTSSNGGERSSSMTTKVTTIVSDEVLNSHAAVSASQPGTGRKHSKQYLHQSQRQHQQKESASYGQPALAATSYSHLQPTLHHPLIPHPLMIPGAPQYIPVWSFQYMQQTPTTSETSGSTRTTTSPIPGPSSATDEMHAGSTASTSTITTSITNATLATTSPVASELAMATTQQAIMTQYPAEWHHHHQVQPASWMPMPMPYTATGTAANYMNTQQSTDPNTTNSSMQNMPLQASLNTGMMHHNHPSATPKSAAYHHQQQQPGGGDGSLGSNSSPSHTGSSTLQTSYDSTTTATPLNYQKPYEGYQHPRQNEIYYGAHAVAGHHGNMMQLYPMPSHYQYLQSLHHGMPHHTHHQMMPAPEWQSTQAYHPQYHHQQYQTIPLVSTENVKDRNNFALARES
ncbi:hypothetical protein SeMB42_g05933 [Synchytrium endobioticum]|uniref:RRM domain-containing protein n=1 Tax=Synchytrium endobioticum TaxID=286115 RepID=A0A507CLL7_9FUNG|nr:hypothetical protein SeLEV6574_g07446 [Synchytrium endobioticum]TPX40583.1 hypothetical protein SeMB42_g05933 [Synchytrium endobioticum]